MADLVSAIGTRGAARGVSVHKMQAQMERVAYLAEKTPWFSKGLSPQRENPTCRYIRDHLLPLLDGTERRKVAVGKGRYDRAMERLDEADGLRVRMGLLDGLIEKMRAMGETRLEGEAAHAWKVMLMEAEALVLKKRGTASLRLFVERGESECICLAEKSLKAAVERWEALGSGSLDHAKALYWLALAKYGMEKDEEAAKFAQKCMEMCEGEEGREWLHGNAADVLARARIELNRERLTC